MILCTVYVHVLCVHVQCVRSRGFHYTMNGFPLTALKYYSKSSVEYLDKQIN